MVFSPEETLRQLGGRKFIAMTGANHFVKGRNFITFKVPKAMNGIKYIKIVLTSSDLYDMIFMTQNGKVVKEYNGIYFDQLQSIFTQNTGLYTHL